jgi:hypothetical protein
MGFSLLGGVAGGSSQSNASQEATVQFNPTVNDNSGSDNMTPGNAPTALVSPYPAGQGLLTLNEALPSSYAVSGGTSSSSDPLSTVASDLGLSSTTPLYLALAIAAAYFFFWRK